MLIILGAIVFYMGWTVSVKHRGAQNSLPSEMKIRSCKSPYGSARGILAFGELATSGQQCTINLSKYVKYLEEYSPLQKQISTLDLCNQKILIPIWIYPNGYATGRIPENGNIRDPRVSAFYSYMISCYAIATVLSLVGIFLLFFKRIMKSMAKVSKASFLLFIAAYILPLFISAQPAKIDSFYLLNLTARSEQISFLRYPPDYLVRKSEKLFTSTDLNRPEAVLQSMINADSEDKTRIHSQITKRFKAKTEGHYKKIKQNTSESLAFKLLFKISTTNRNRKICFIKYQILDYEKSIGYNAVIRLIQLEGQWKIMTEELMTNLDSALLHLQPDFLDFLFGESKSVDPVGITLKEECTPNLVLDFNILTLKIEHERKNESKKYETLTNKIIFSL